MTSEDEKPASSNSGASSIARDSEKAEANFDNIALPTHIAGSGTLDRLVDTARDYAKASTAENTNKAYAAD
ncbi:hypothetical protein SAMN04488523_1458 [Sulfitobacter brevis]|uniref:Uncharacterized protein n=1 Tax=Sulfitobacter brevis TaxID=74348 RepID=A0A1I2HD04_9RHOB|nr:hypothetical protein SAMN04488523_1458 [Sulfitobacter brevis]